MSILVGSTGFVGKHLHEDFEFDLSVHRSNINEIKGKKTDLLICAGLPAEKWKANQSPQSDFLNMSGLAQILSTVRSEKAILISTIDVYQPVLKVNENDSPSLNGISAYGRNRAWFEFFFRANFSKSLVIRLPGLFAMDVRKNLIHDLLHNKSAQLQNVHRESQFQFFNLTQVWDFINFGLENDVSILNVTSEPIIAQEIASLFNVMLGTNSPKAAYDMRSIYAKDFSGKNGYMYSKENIIEQISYLKEKFLNS